MANRRGPRRTMGAALAVALAVAGCSSSDGSAGDDATTTAAPTTTAVPDFEQTAEQAVDGNYRQGLARVDDGWIFITNATVYRTDDDLVEVTSHHDAMPPELAAQGYDHLGDGDVHDGLLWVPAERPDKDEARQATVRFDAETLEVVDHVEVEQFHNSWIAVDDDGVAWSMPEFSSDQLVRYRIEDGEAVPLAPVTLSRTVDKVQGGDLAGGALWLSTDDDVGGVYRVDLDTGEVTQVGTTGRVDGEGEGIDAADGDPAALWVLVADAAIVPMWLVELQPAATTGG